MAYWILYYVALQNSGDAFFSLFLHHHGSRLFQLALFQHGCFFALGIYLWLHFLKRPARRNLLIFPLLVAVGISQIIFQNTELSAKTGIHFSPLAPVLIWTATVFFVIVAIKWNGILYKSELIPRVLRKIGLMTYPLYLIHQVVGSLLLGWLIGAGVEKFLALGSSIAAMVALSAVVSSFLERPIRQIIDRIAFALRAFYFDNFVGSIGGSSVYQTRPEE